MLAAIGVSSIDELFQDIPERVRLDRPLDLEPALSEPELVAHLEELAGRNAHTGPGALVPRRRDLRPLRARDRGRDPRPRRVPDRVHAVPAGDEPGRPPGDLRVPDGDLRAHRYGRLQRLGVRRHDGGRRRLLRREAHDRPDEGRPRGGVEPAGPAGREDVRARLRPRGRRGSAHRRDHRPGRRPQGGRRRCLRHLPAAELLRLPRAGSRARSGRERSRGPRRGARRPGLARSPRGARALRLRDRDRRRAGRRQLPVVRRAALRVHRHALGLHPAHAGPHRRRDDRHRG